MAKKSGLTKVAVKIGTAVGKADKTAHKFAKAGSLAKRELDDISKQVDALKSNWRRRRKNCGSRCADVRPAIRFVSIGFTSVCSKGRSVSRASPFFLCGCRCAAESAQSRHRFAEAGRRNLAEDGTRHAADHSLFGFDRARDLRAGRQHPRRAGICDHEEGLACGALVVAARRTELQSFDAARFGDCYEERRNNPVRGREGKETFPGLPPLADTRGGQRRKDVSLGDFLESMGFDQGFFGLGQHQAGVWNYHGETVDISEANTNISVPIVLSSNGYAIYWNNSSRSRFNNRFPHELYLSSEVADTVDYYFIYGPEFDNIVAAYRDMTGQAPMFGKWAYGFWQCKNKYVSQEEVLGVAHKYRELHIPVDNIVQDWFWWNIMGEPVFNKNYPDPKGMIDDLHQNHFHAMFSFWPYFRPGSPVYDEMDKHGYFVDKMKVSGFHPAGQALYDAFNPAAREYYWGLIDKGLFKIGADAWWLDTDEPETEGRETNILVTNKVALGSGARYANLYPLMTTTAVYEGQRKASDQKRVFILSRSAFAGAQRNSITAWSGDVESNWLSFARQIPAGLNFSLSGIPYWTTDIGGFIIGNPDDPAYRELFVRWFE